MEEGPNSNDGLATGGNAGGVFGSNNSMAPTGLSSFPNGVDEVQYVVDDGDGRKKSKKWLIGGVVFGVLLIIMIAFVVLKQTGVVEKVISGGRMSNTELVEKIEQANYDLSNLSIGYNNSFNVDNVNNNNIDLYNKRDFEGVDEEYDEVENEINDLPASDQTMLNDADKETYSRYKDEMKTRFNSIKDGKELLKEFQLSFFSPLVDYVVNEGGQTTEYEGKNKLLTSSDPNVRKVANEFEGLEQVVKNGGGQDEVNVYLTEHTDLISDFMQCFETVEDPDAFYDDVNDFVKSVRTRYGVL